MATESVDELKERLAAIEHQRWADWQEYLHTKMKHIPQGLLMSPKYYEALELQIHASWEELTEEERQHDRDEIERYWPLIEAYITRECARKVLEGRIRELEQWNAYGHPNFHQSDDLMKRIDALKAELRAAIQEMEDKP